MATRTKPLMSAAALATAAAVAVATPALAPSITSATSPALSSANVELANFAALLSIPASEWNNVLYEGWGGAIGTIPPIDPDPNTYADYWLPYCDYDCSIGGISGVTYLALDALINGTNGYYTPSDPNNPTDGYAAWDVSAVNYFYEGSFSTGLQYILESPFLGYPYKAPGPLYNPAVANAIALAFQGPYIVTTLYTTALTLAAVAANNIPYIGEYLYRGIGSYLGPQFSSIDAEYDYGNGLYVGISGVLRYIGGVITTGGNPNPYPILVTTPAASTAASNAAPAAKIPASVTASLAGTPAAPVADIKVAAASTESGSTPAVSASPTATTAGSTASEAASEATPATTTAADAVANTPAATAAATKPAAAAAPSRKRPARSAAASAAKAVTKAVSGAVSGAAAGAGSATDGASAAN